MSLELFEVFPAVFVGGSTLNIQHLESCEPEGFPEEMMITGAGSVDPLAFSTAKAEPKWNLTSRDLLAILAKVSVTAGFACTGKFQFRQQASGADYTSGSTHKNITTPAGFLYIDEFGAKQNDKEGADIKLKYHALYDGTTSPTTWHSGQALSSSVAITGTHALGPVDFEGQTGGLGGVQSWRAKPGISTESMWGDGGLWPTTCRIKERRPMIEIEGNNLTVAATLGLNTVYPITSGITCYLLNCTAAGRDDVGNSTHISVTATAGIYKLTGITGSKGVSSVTKITVMPTAISVSYAATVDLP